ncbi:MAG: leucine-rich repeat domain-containing protein [Firmicutes bacterium]|nr:leucine-rich repeat domain-containing protein [Bacillota bacterium]
MKKTFSVILIIILALAFTLGSNLAYAEDDGEDPGGTCSCGLTWSISKEGVLSIGGSGEFKDFVDGARPPWTAYNDRIKVIDIYEGVYGIGVNTFKDMKEVTTVILPESLITMADSAFRNDIKLESINLPSKLTEIGEFAFGGCSSLAEVNFKGSAIAIGDGAFEKCSSLESIVLPDKTKLGREAFFECFELKSVTLGKDMTEIDASCFLECDELTEVALPSGISMITNYDCVPVKQVYIVEEGSEAHEFVSASDFKFDLTTGHSFGKMEVIKEHTTTEDGEAILTCKTCLRSFDQVIPKGDHDWDDNYTVDKPATCMEEGSESIHCTLCGHKQEGSDRTIPITDHNWSQWQVTEEATYTKEGIEERSCSNCGNSETRAISMLERISLSGAKIASVKDQVYSGKSFTPKPSVTLDGKKLAEGKDYTIKYSNNKKVGKATATITGIEGFKGTAKAYFIIKPAKAVINKVVPAKKSVKITIKSQKTSGVQGYQIAYRKGTGKWKTLKTTKLTNTINNLTSNKKYSFKVRAYKTIDGKAVYGAYSKVTSTKTKKA